MEREHAPHCGCQECDPDTYNDDAAIAAYEDACEMCGTTTGQRICAACLRHLSAVADLDDSAHY